MDSKCQNSRRRSVDVAILDALQLLFCNLQLHPAFSGPFSKAMALKMLCFFDTCAKVDTKTR